MSPGDQQVLLPEEDAFKALVADVRGIIQASQGRIAAVVNTEIVTTYWQIGERIVREEQGGPGRAMYGEQLPCVSSIRPTQFAPHCGAN